MTDTGRMRGVPQRSVVDWQATNGRFVASEASVVVAGTKSAEKFDFECIASQALMLGDAFSMASESTAKSHGLLKQW